MVGISHAGVNFAFALRREGWTGDIILFDADPMLPYHRPPLSKAYLYDKEDIEKHRLKSADSYQQEGIRLRLGVWVSAIDRANKCIRLQDGSIQAYDQLVLATGARPLIPTIPGIESANCLYTLRTAADVNQIRQALHNSDSKRVVIIGGGYVGLETAASLKKLGAKVTVLEREERILARVTAPEMSQFFQDLHCSNGVEILTDKNVTAVESVDNGNEVTCSDGSRFSADIIIVGIGIRVNLESA